MIPPTIPNTSVGGSIRLRLIGFEFNVVLFLVYGVAFVCILLSVQNNKFIFIPEKHFGQCIITVVIHSNVND